MPKKNAFRLHAVIPVERVLFDSLALGTPQSRADELVVHVLEGMNQRAAERKRRVFESPWIDRIEESDDAMLVHFLAETEPA